MRFGYWLPVFGGWLRNVADENMEASWAYVKRLAQRSEQIGFDLTLIAELNLNDIKGVDAPSLDAWSTAAALAAVTERIEVMVAVRPTFHQPALLAKQFRSAQIRRGLRTTRRSLCPHQRMARCRRWRLETRQFLILRKVLPRRRQRPSAKTRFQTASNALRRWRIPRCQRTHRRQMRRLPHARRPARTRRGKNR